MPTKRDVDSDAASGMLGKIHQMMTVSVSVMTFSYGS